LNDLSQIRFLVIDEADRMVTQGSFPELTRILDAVHRANPMDEDGDEDDNLLDDDPGDDAAHRLYSLPGVPGEAKVQMLTDEILQRIEQQKGQGQVDNGSGLDSDDDNDDAMEDTFVSELDDEEYEEAEKDLEKLGGDIDEEDAISLPTAPPVRRQTFVYSATLTLPASSMYAKSQKKKRSDIKVDGAIAEILEKAHAKGKTKVVDLATDAKKERTGTTAVPAVAAKDGKGDRFHLPAGLTLHQIKCTQRHKDSYLYAYLMMTDEGTAGPSLVFCNSIAAVRRVGATLTALGMDVRILHAHMQQRARFKAVESLRTSKKRTVVVATDVAARGLDTPSVATVVHYDVARAVDTFVHRSGRTARGMGERAIGSSLSLVGPSEDKPQAQIRNSLKTSFENVNIDGRLLRQAQERVNLACKIVSADDVNNRSMRNKCWMKEKAEEIGFDLDEELLEGGLEEGDQRDQSRAREAAKAKEKLKLLLAQPIRTQRHGKFLSTNSAVRQKEAGPVIALHQHTRSRSRSKRR